MTTPDQIANTADTTERTEAGEPSLRLCQSPQVCGLRLWPQSRSPPNSSQLRDIGAEPCAHARAAGRA
jgi:hypothetical protein